MLKSHGFDDLINNHPWLGYALLAVGILFVAVYYVCLFEWLFLEDWSHGRDPWDRILGGWR